MAQSRIPSGILSNGLNSGTSWTNMEMCGYIRRRYFREQGILLLKNYVFGRLFDNVFLKM